MSSAPTSTTCHRRYEANALGNLGKIESRLGDAKSALESTLEGIRTRVAIGDRPGAARGRCDAAYALIALGRRSEARTLAKESLRLWRELGDRLGERLAHSVLGGISSHEGRVGDGFTHQWISADLARGCGSVWDECGALNNLGDALLDLGRIEAAATAFARARAIAASTGFRYFESFALAGLGDVQWQRGDAAGAVGSHESALAIRRDRCSTPT